MPALPALATEVGDDFESAQRELLGEAPELLEESEWGNNANHRFADRSYDTDADGEIDTVVTEYTATFSGGYDAKRLSIRKENLRALESQPWWFVRVATNFVRVDPPEWYPPQTYQVVERTRSAWQEGCHDFELLEDENGDGEVDSEYQNSECDDGV